MADAWVRDQGVRLRATLDATMQTSEDTRKLRSQRWPLPVAHVDAPTGASWSTSDHVKKMEITYTLATDDPGVKAAASGGAEGVGNLLGSDDAAVVGAIADGVLGGLDSGVGGVDPVTGAVVGGLVAAGSNSEVAEAQWAADVAQWQQAKIENDIDRFNREVGGAAEVCNLPGQTVPGTEVAIPTDLDGLAALGSQAAEAAGSNQTAFNFANLSALNETALNLVSNLTSGMPEFASGEYGGGEFGSGDGTLERTTVPLNSRAAHPPRASPPPRAPPCDVPEPVGAPRGAHVGRRHWPRRLGEPRPPRARGSPPRSRPAA